MGNKQSWFVDKRAEALALLLLTDRKDLRVRRLDPDGSLDFEVELLRAGKPTGKLLGVAVRGVELPLRPEELAKVHAALEKLDALRVTLPVCLFLFSPRNEAGLYGWILEPEVRRGVIPHLRFHARPELQPLGARALDEIVALTDKYYDALVVVLKGHER